MKLAGIVFDRVLYDREADVLYLHVGEPSTAVDWDEAPEGHASDTAGDGSLVSVTIVNARRLLERDGEIAITLPQQRIVAADLADVLAAA